MRRLFEYILHMRMGKLKFIFIISLYCTLGSSLLCCEAIASDDVDCPTMVEDKNGDVTKIIDDDKGIFTAILENDVFIGTDRGYSNGVNFSYLSSEKNCEKWLKNKSSYLPLFNKDGKRRFSVAVGQNIYTPSDIKKSEFIENDFLYAGWLYGSMGVISDTGTVYENTVLTLGVVGPYSLAEPTQKFVHKVVDSPDPKGWDHQLKNEPGVNFTYERKWRTVFEAQPFGVGVDVIPHVGANLGNVLTNATIGTTFRLGYDLHSDYGPPHIRPTLAGSEFFIPSKKLGGYLFSGVEVRAVARNIFLDGNTFQDGPSLDKRTIVKTIQYGATLTYGDLRISYNQVFITKEFKGQPHRGSRFGALLASYRF